MGSLVSITERQLVVTCDAEGCKALSHTTFRHSNEHRAFDEHMGYAGWTHTFSAQTGRWSFYCRTHREA